MGLSKDQAGSLFEKYKVGLWRSVVEHGFERYRKQPGKSDHRLGTAASLIHDYMVAGARKVFTDEVEARRVRFIEVKGADVTLMEIEETAVVWFKKLGAGRNARPNKTRLSANLVAGSCDEIPGITPAATLLHVGYTLNLLHTAVARVSIVRPQSCGNRPEWFIDLEEPATSLVVSSRDRDSSGEGSRTALKLIISPTQTKMIQ